MPDLGRWNGIDQLAESYLSTSSYAYVANNPVSQFDVDGRWFNADGSIDTSGRTPGFTSGRQMYSQFLGYRPGDGGGGGDVSALLARAGNLGGTWNNTGFGFMDDSGISLGYDGRYKSLNANFQEGGMGDPINYLEEVFVTGKKGGGFGEDSYNGLLMYSKFTGVLGRFTYNQNSSILADAVENTKVGRSVSAAENFMFLELPASLAGGELLAAGWRAAGMSRLICGPMGRLTNGIIKICFTEGTLVAVEKESKKIEDIKVGDLVWSYNEETGKKELKKVVALSRNISTSLVKISVSGTEIICTPEHPFYVNGNWVEAKDLVKGMALTTLDRKTSTVEFIKFLDEKVKVYNFEVEGNHNYYVSEKGILVHNTCWTERLGMFMEYAANIETKSLTSQEATIKHLESIFKALDKTRTDDRIIKLVADDMGNVFPEAKGILRIQQRGAGNATYVYPDGGFQIFQNGKLIINKIK